MVLVAMIWASMRIKRDSIRKGTQLSIFLIVVVTSGQNTPWYYIPSLLIMIIIFGSSRRVFKLIQSPAGKKPAKCLSGNLEVAWGGDLDRNRGA
jgi:hypothetical protein